MSRYHPIVDQRSEGDVSRRGEYTFLKRHINDDTPKIIVDVGALGKTSSNSWNLIGDDGWRGILVEPRPGAAEAIRNEFSGDFVLEQLAISDHEGEATLYRFPTLGWSSLDPNRAIKSGKSRTWRKAPIVVGVTTLPKLLEKHNVPHRFGVLSVDVEGLESKVIVPMLATPWRPDFILMEDTHGTFDHGRLAGVGYKKLISHGGDHLWQREALTT
jgi:FkbM family methyltransferase